MKLRDLKGLYADQVIEYTESILEGRKLACREDIQKCERFVRDLESEKWDIDTRPADIQIKWSEKTFYLHDGQTVDGKALAGTTIVYQPWQLFDIYNIFIFYDKETGLRRFGEAYIMTPRKQGKSTYITSMAHGMGYYYRKSNASIGILSASLKDTKAIMDLFIANIEKYLYGSKLQARRDGWKLTDNNNEHRIYNPNFLDGTIDIEAYAHKDGGQHGLKKLITIIDEVHLMKSAVEFKSFQKSTQIYANGLNIAITTAGISRTSFCYEYTEYAKKILSGEIVNDRMYVHISKADEDDDGQVDMMDPDQLEKACPSLGVTVSKERLLADAETAMMSSDLKVEFLAYTLNIFQNKVKAYFNVNKFVTSNELYDWSLEELADIPITWYGGVDLSRKYDLTAGALYGEYAGVGIIIPHAWFPRTEATNKAREDNIDLFGWEEDGDLTICNGNIIDEDDVVDWFCEMEDLGFSISSIGVDKQYAKKFKFKMMDKGFDIDDQAQTDYAISPGFNEIQDKVIDEKLYYLDSSAFEYCVQNLKVRDLGPVKQLRKVSEKGRIDIFMAAVFAAVQKIKSIEEESEEEEFKEWLTNL